MRRRTGSDHWPPSPAQMPLHRSRRFPARWAGATCEVPIKPAKPSRRPAGPWAPRRQVCASAACEASHLPACCAADLQDQFEISRDVILTARQVVETLTPLMTEERMQRIDQARAARRPLGWPRGGGAGRRRGGAG